ncbi:hypothetical protein P7C73_g5896, partial [Tremellales sp. Uapishka_1]
MRLALLAPLLPLITALQLPHFTPQDALHAADSLLHPEVTLSYGNDMTLSSIPNDDHVVIKSARHPKHQIRIKSTDGWCDSVKSYSGYLDVGYGKDLFFYFFESRSKPDKDPVVMWINGGPGCSSALGLFMELGPCSIKDKPTSVNDTERNPYAWNERANIFFLDEPIGVGFSRGEHGQGVANTEEAARDVQAFVSIFFETFKEFEGRDFHMAGESYGGRYLPVFASAVVDGNRQLKADGKKEINLKSVMIGNGITDSFSTLESYYPYQCTINGGLNTTVQSIANCVIMAEAVPKCHKFTKASCIDSHDYTACSMALSYCEEMLGSSFIGAGVNPYDVTRPCTLDELRDSLCYPVTKKIKTYLDLPDVRGLLGVSVKRDNWSSCDDGVNRAFGMSLDSTAQTWLYVTQLLERGIRILNYAGTQDFICNHIANEMWMEKLAWTGKQGFNDAQWGNWKVNGKVAGSFKSYENLTLLKVLGAGHMVPYDKPVEALDMLNSWLDATEPKK